MAKPVPQSELNAICAVVARFPQGAALDDIERALTLKLPRRTLQRRLAQLVRDGRLASSGRGRGSRYLIPTVPRTEADHADEVSASEEGYIPISRQGQLVKNAVRRPIHQRQPVGYTREFLDEYQPNESYYLSPDVRERLMSAGLTPDPASPPGTYVKEIYKRLLIDLSWNSSRLEGNTYSLLETERLLELGESAEGKNALEAQMILNHKGAIDLLVEESPDVGFNRYTILNLHALLSDNLLSDPQACGRLRQRAVGIDGTVFHPLEVPQLIDECFQQVLETASAIKDPFEQAFFSMVHLPYLQPFEDVNKRVSRLAANIPLIRNNLCPLSFVDVPVRAYIDGILGVYELNRVDLLCDVFLWAYQRSCARYSAVRRSLGEPDTFRLRYRSILAETVAAIVRNHMDSKRALDHIKQRAYNDIPEVDQPRFIEVTETELMGLHEGNIARYRLKPSEYQRWRESWK